MYAVLLDMVTNSITADHAPALRPGATFHATVEGATGRLTAVSGSLRVPLPEAAPFQARQSVLIEVRDSPQGLQLVVRPADAPPPAPQPPAPSLPDLAPLIRMVTEALTAAGVTADPQTATEILPPSLPRNDAALHEFFAAFSSAASPGDEWPALRDLVARAVAAGALPRRLADLLTNAQRQFDAAKPATIEAALARAADDATPIEAKLAAALASKDPQTVKDLAAHDVRTLVETLQKNEPFQSFLRSAGQSKAFGALAEKLVSRLAEPGVQNIRGLDQPYMFLQIPCPPDGPFRRAHLHVVSGGRRGQRIDHHTATLALDVSTAHLGDLWITISLTGNHCACRFRARSQEAVKAVKAAAPDLEAALKRAGYAAAAVQAGLWDGDRLLAMADLLRPYSGIDVEA